ncbi:hypothetical protein HMPREF0650_0578 [Hoylesella buccalis ATCC 35310]|uniref:Uncharacterized protein n=1 Tax=Hoylesella buccalis ATCC 35310 TaxID=679190 RepID=D1W7V0_9BACT|nr:hypothetical protein HMPREF0650_0578 [Hoylesella buccalis ATCC 35310]
MNARKKYLFQGCFIPKYNEPFCHQSPSSKCSSKKNLTPTDARNSYMKQHLFDAFKAKGVR